MKPTATFNRQQATALAKACRHATSLADAARIIREHANALPMPIGALATPTKYWKTCLYHLAKALERKRDYFAIVKLDGNKKLPFATFSSLPGLLDDGGTCHGAGDCLTFCYSYRAWRYPAAYCRQLQNTLLLRFDKVAIAREFMALPDGVVLRLYVDGDFDSLDTVAFWFALLARRADVQCYGYSKSWELLYAFATRYPQRVPSNYLLNLSSGGRDQLVTLADMVKNTTFVRGEFVAVPLQQKHAKGFKRYNSKEYHRDVRQSASDAGIGRVFSCPGNCGACLPKGEHACGSTRFVDVKIAIGVH